MRWTVSHGVPQGSVLGPIRTFQSNPIHFIYIAQFKQTQGSQSAVQQDKKHTKKHTTEAQ